MNEVLKDGYEYVKEVFKKQKGLLYVFGFGITMYLHHCHVDVTEYSQYIPIKILDIILSIGSYIFNNIWWILFGLICLYWIVLGINKLIKDTEEEYITSRGTIMTYSHLNALKRIIDSGMCLFPGWTFYVFVNVLKGQFVKFQLHDWLLLLGNVVIVGIFILVFCVSLQYKESFEKISSIGITYNDLNNYYQMNSIDKNEEKNYLLLKHKNVQKGYFVVAKVEKHRVEDKYRIKYEYKVNVLFNSENFAEAKYVFDNLR